MVECKYNDEELSKNLLYFQLKTKTPYALQVVHKKDVLKKLALNSMIQYVVSADRFLQYLQ